MRYRFPTLGLLRRAPSPPRKGMPWADRWHRVISPMVGHGLAACAIVVAWWVLGVQQRATDYNRQVQQEAAERNTRELEYRIARLDEFNKRLEEHQRRLEEQQKRLAEEVQVSDAIMASVNKMYTTLIALVQGHMWPTNASIGLLGLILSKSPNHTPAERRLLQTITDAASIQNELITIASRHYNEFDEVLKRLRTDYQKAMATAPKERQVQLSNEYTQQVNRAGERYSLQVERDTAVPQDRLRQVRAAQQQVLSELGKAEKAQGKR
jgi:hypothetical protein